MCDYNVIFTFLTELNIVYISHKETNQLRYGIKSLHFSPTGQHISLYCCFKAMDISKIFQGTA